MHLGVRAALDALPDGVEFVLAIGAAPPPIEADVMEKLVLKVGPADPILAALQKAFKLIDDGVAEGGVLVVSEDGEEEAAAAAIVVGWAMARQGVNFADAPALVAKAVRMNAPAKTSKSKRPQPERRSAFLQRDTLPAVGLRKLLVPVSQVE